MKKTICLFLIFFLITTVCILCFLSTENNVQAVLFSPVKALQSNSIFAMRNGKTNQIYILKTDKKGAAFSLYRYISDDVMKKYEISGSRGQTFLSDHAEWMPENSFSLPTDPCSVMKELQKLYNGKDDTTDAVKALADTLLSFFVSTSPDSSRLLDYAAFPAVFEHLNNLLHQKQTRTAIGFRIIERGYLTTCECTPFSKEDFRLQLASLLAELFYEDQKDLFCAAIEELFTNLETCTLHIQRNLFGQFQSLYIYNEGCCVFSIEKFK